MSPSQGNGSFMSSFIGSSLFGQASPPAGTQAAQATTFQETSSSALGLTGAYFTGPAAGTSWQGSLNGFLESSPLPPPTPSAPPPAKKRKREAGDDVAYGVAPMGATGYPAPSLTTMPAADPAVPLFDLGAEPTGFSFYPPQSTMTIPAAAPASAAFDWSAGLSVAHHTPVELKPSVSQGYGADPTPGLRQEVANRLPWIDDSRFIDSLSIFSLTPLDLVRLLDPNKPTGAANQARIRQGLYARHDSASSHETKLKDFIAIFASQMWSLGLAWHEYMRCLVILHPSETGALMDAFMWHWRFLLDKLQDYRAEAVLEYHYAVHLKRLQEDNEFIAERWHGAVDEAISNRVFNDRARRSNRPHVGPAVPQPQAVASTTPIPESPEGRAHKRRIDAGCYRGTMVAGLDTPRDFLELFEWFNTLLMAWQNYGMALFNLTPANDRTILKAFDWHWQFLARKLIDYRMEAVLLYHFEVHQQRRESGDGFQPLDWVVPDEAAIERNFTPATRRPDASQINRASGRQLETTRPKPSVKYNNGHCTDPCRSGRRHVCDHCKLPHPLVACPIVLSLHLPKPAGPSQ